MAIQGDLRTMSLAELLQWAGSGGKTGTLEFERRNVAKRVLFRKGRVIACSSDDPPTLLGQFLLFRGKITQDVLRQGLDRQEKAGGNLGAILLEMGAIDAGELTRFVESKVEETIYGLFDWEEGAFRFHEDLPDGPNLVEVDLAVEDILLRGLERYDEVRRIRQVFHDPGIVLKRTGRSLPPDLAGGEMERRVLELVDGERTLAELLLHSHAPEFVVTKFLFELFGRGLVEIQEIRPLAPRSEAAPGELDASMVPLLTRPAVSLDGEDLSPMESFLVSLMDGSSDIKSILWVAPMPSVEVMGALRRMLDRGIVVLRDPS